MTEHDPRLEELLTYLKEARGFDFTGYKRSTLMRRVQRRMHDVGDSSYVDYRDRLELHPEEFTALFNTILINVTSFFRDPDAWEHLRSNVVPELLAQRATGPLRMWSAGCASGQEAYSLAIVLAEAMGPDGFRERVKIYATDVDEEALAEARQASYTQREMSGVPPELAEKYFEPTGPRWTFRKDLRRTVIFGRNDLVQDAPISHVDLLLCRNALMYFNAETQARILQRLHFALNEAGTLFLGKAEMLLSHGALFTAVDLRRRFFRKVPVRLTDRMPLGGAPSLDGAPPVAPEARVLREALLAGPSAQLVIDGSSRLAVTNRRAEVLFGLSQRDVGRPFHDLEVSFRPVDLRTAVQEAHTGRRAVSLRDVELHRGPEAFWFDVQVVPLLEPDGRVLGTTVLFTDVTRPRELRGELEYANRELETAYEELQSTNEELRERTREVGELNAFMASVFAGLRAGVVVVDSELLVQVWNDQAEELWGVRHDEAAGRHLLSLDIGLPLDEVRRLVRPLLAGDQQEVSGVIPAVNRRGRPVVVRVTASPLRYGEAVNGVILVMEPREDAEPAGRVG